MTLDAFLQQAGIPLLLFLICAYYGLKLLILKDVSIVRGKDKPPVKDKEEFSKRGGLLILFYGAASLVMMGLLFVNLYVALIQIIVCTLIFAVLWKKMNDAYGG